MFSHCFSSRFIAVRKTDDATSATAAAAAMVGLWRGKCYSYPACTQDAEQKNIRTGRCGWGHRCNSERWRFSFKREANSGFFTFHAEPSVKRVLQSYQESLCDFRSSILKILSCDSFVFSGLSFREVNMNFYCALLLVSMQT